MKETWMMRDNLRLPPIKEQPAFSGGRQPEEATFGRASLDCIQGDSLVNTHICTTWDCAFAPGIYVVAAEVEEVDKLFEQKMERLATKLEVQFEEGGKIEEHIMQFLDRIDYQ